MKTKRKKLFIKNFKALKAQKNNFHIKKNLFKKEPQIQNKKTIVSPEPLFRANIKVIGIGGGGGAIVSEIGRFLGKVTFVIADTDVRAFKKRRGIKYFSFGQDMTHGLGTGLNPELGIAAAEKEKERIAKLFENQDIVIFVASLGGGLGSGATQVFAEISKNFSGITFGIFTLPFKFEGKNKYNIATKSIRVLRKFLNVSITIPNERIFKIIDENTPITEAFSLVNKTLINSLESLIDLIYSPGIINIDFADVRAVLNGKGNLAFLNTAEASGKNRAEKIIHKILYNPLYQNSNFGVEKILFNIMGGGNLSMFEVNKISEAIAEKNPKAKIIFGISKNPKFKNTIQTTLLMTGQGVGSDISLQKKRTLKPVLKKEKPLVKPSKNRKLKKKRKTKISIRKDRDNDKFSLIDTLIPNFNVPDNVGSLRKLSITESPNQQKKSIRRTALEVKKAQEIEENKKSQQEKEWEIPAFLRKIKFKP